MSQPIKADLLIKIGRVFGQQAAHILYSGLANEPVSAAGVPVDWDVIETQIVHATTPFGASPPERVTWRES